MDRTRHNDRIRAMPTTPDPYESDTKLVRQGALPSEGPGEPYVLASHLEEIADALGENGNRHTIHVWTDQKRGEQWGRILSPNQLRRVAEILREGS